MKKLIYFFAGLLMLIFNACGHKEQTQGQSPKTAVSAEDATAELYRDYAADPASRFEEERNALIEYAMNNGIAAVSSPSGLMYEIQDLGTGDFLKSGEEVSAHYRGMFLDGTEFDSSYKRGEPLTFKVGQMMKAWNEGLTFMKKGDKAVFLIPSKIGYGERGFPGYVPPNTPMVFELEVLP